MAKSKTKNLMGLNFVEGRPKKTRQGNGRNSKPKRSNYKLTRGQGK